MNKRKQEPRLWIALVQAYDTEERTWKSLTLTSTYAHITRTAGLNDVTARMFKSFKNKRYTKIEIVSVFGMRWSEIENAFSDYQADDDSGDNGDGNDKPPKNPEPEDHGVDLSIFERALEDTSITGNMFWRS
jgi:hypothetical protein